jgi:quercetin dioxygenase-like cupin family protein
VKSVIAQYTGVSDMLYHRRRLAHDVANSVFPAHDARVQQAERAASEPTGQTAEPDTAGELPTGDRVIVNPISGERIAIRLSGAETGGKLLAFDLFLPPGAHVPAGHVHPIQEEQFTVVSGLMRFRIGRLGRRNILAHPGETIRVPAGTAHWFGNPGAKMAHARVEVRPALRTGELFQMTGKLSLVGHLGRTQLPRLTDLAHVVLEYQREVAVPNVPGVLVTLLLAPLARVGRRRREADARRRSTG